MSQDQERQYELAESSESEEKVTDLIDQLNLEQQSDINLDELDTTLKG